MSYFCILCYFDNEENTHTDILKQGWNQNHHMVQYFLKYLDPNRTSGHVAVHILPRQALVLKRNILTSITQK